MKSRLVKHHGTPDEGSGMDSEPQCGTKEDMVMAREREGSNPQVKAAPRNETGLRRMRRGAMVIVALAGLMVPAGTALADTQRLPDEACNQGTPGTGKRGPVPHRHDFDQDGEFGCYHRNPALPSQRSE